MEGGCRHCYRPKIRQPFEEFLLYTVDKVSIFGEETVVKVALLREEIVVLAETDESMPVSFVGYAIFGRHSVNECDRLRGHNQGGTFLVSLGGPLAPLRYCRYP